jgi:PleD family two-component response regulator
MVMPVMDGFEFLKQFSLTQYYKEIPIIVLSSMDDDQSIEKVLEYDVYDYLIKPLNNIKRQIFINKVKNAMKLKSPNNLQ